MGKLTFDEFVAKYNDKFLEVAGSSDALNQCVDLANGYLRDVLNLPIVEWTNAKDFPLQVNPNNFEYILDAPGIVPQKGDLVIWNSGTWGHIAICLYVDVEIPWFTSFDENWPLGSVCHKVDHSYTNVVGWLRPKGENTMPTTEIMQIEKEDYNRLRTGSESYDSTVGYLEIETSDLTMTPFEKVKAVIAGFKSRATDQLKRAVKSEAEAKNREEQVVRLKKQLLDEQILRKELNIKLKKVVKGYVDDAGVYEAHIEKLQGQVDAEAKQKGTCLIKIAELEIDQKDINMIKNLIDRIIKVVKDLIEKYKK